MYFSKKGCAYNGDWSKAPEAGELSRILIATIEIPAANPKLSSGYWDNDQEPEIAIWPPKREILYLSQEIWISMGRWCCRSRVFDRGKLEEREGSCIAVNGTPSHSYRVTSLAIWDHTVLPATRHKWTHPALTPARQAGTRFTDPGGTKGWINPGDRSHTVIPIWFTRPQTVSHPSTNPTEHDRKSNSQHVDHKPDGPTP